MTLAGGGGGQHGRGREAKEGGNGRGQGSWRSSAFHFSVTTHSREGVSASAPIHLESVEDHLIQPLDNGSHICSEHTHQYLSSGTLDWYGMRVYQKGRYGSSWAETRAVRA